MEKSKMKDIYQKIIITHALLPHPEGGFYKETYRSEFSTAIFYLLTKGQKSSFHRIKSDEGWHFYQGDSLVIVELTKEGTVKETLLDKNHPQYVVPANVWFGAYLPDNSEYAFTGCTVAPAFKFSDFEIADRDKLLLEFPLAKELIKKLCD